MENKILFKNSVFKDLDKIDCDLQGKIRKKLIGELSVNSRSGKPLKGKYKGLYSLRFSDYRIVYSIISGGGILVVKIGHRKDVYK